MNTPENQPSKIELSIKKIVDKIILFRKRLSNDVILIEIGNQYLNLAKASFANNSINYTDINQFKLPENAIERSVPTDPSEMGAFIKEVINEEKLHAIRASIVLSPDASYSRLVDLPAELSLEEAYSYITKPSAGLQIPIPIQNNDFDLTATNLPVKKFKETLFRPYLLTAIPKNSVDLVLKTAEEAGLEVTSLDIGFISQARLISNHIYRLSDSEYIALLDFSSECTHLTLIDKAGPVLVERLASIRDYATSKDISEEKQENQVNQLENRKRISDDMPISKIDLRVFFREFTTKLKAFFNANSITGQVSIYISGRSSEHRELVNIMGSNLKMPVFHLSPANCLRVGKVIYNHKNISKNSLSKLIGLGLGLLDNEDLIQQDDSSKATEFISSYIPDKVITIKGETYSGDKLKPSLTKNMSHTNNKENASYILEDALHSTEKNTIKYEKEEPGNDDNLADKASELDLSANILLDDDKCLLDANEYKTEPSSVLDLNIESKPKETVNKETSTKLSLGDESVATSNMPLDEERTPSIIEETLKSLKQLNEDKLELEFNNENVNHSTNSHDQKEDSSIIRGGSEDTEKNNALQSKIQNVETDKQSESKTEIDKDLFNGLILDGNQDSKTSLQKKSVDKTFRKSESSTSDFKIDPDAIDLN